MSRSRYLLLEGILRLLNLLLSQIAKRCQVVALECLSDAYRRVCQLLPDVLLFLAGVEDVLCSEPVDDAVQVTFQPKEIQTACVDL